MERRKVTYLQKFIHGTGEAGSPHISKFKGHLLAEVSLPQGRSGFCPLRPSTDGARYTQIMESNLLFSKSTGLNVKLV